MPQDIDGAIARGCKASGAALRNRLTMRPANAAKRRRVALPPSRGAKAPDGPPDDDQFQVRKVAAFSCRLWPGSPSRHIRRACSGKCEATLKGTVGEIVALIIRVSATLFRIVQGGPQSCDAPGRNDFEGCRVHLVPPLDRCSPTMQGRKWLYPEVPLNCCQVLPAMRWLRQTCYALPPGISSRLKRLTAPAIALKEPTGLDPRSVDFINAEAQALPGEEVEKPCSQMRCVPT